jgi:hypothetical protein
MISCKGELRNGKKYTKLAFLLPISGNFGLQKRIAYQVPPGYLTLRLLVCLSTTQSRTRDCSSCFIHRPWWPVALSPYGIRYDVKKQGHRCIHYTMGDTACVGSVRFHLGHNKLVPPQHSYFCNKNMISVVALLFPSPSLSSSSLL